MQSPEPYALLIIDMQNDFVLPEGNAFVAGAAQSVPVLTDLLGLARARQWPVLHVIRQHQMDGSNAEPFRRPAYLRGQGICVQDSFGAQIIEQLTPLPGEAIVRKQRFSGFFQTDLDQRLRALGAGHLLISGTQYPNCIRGTAMDALYRDYQVTVITDACSAADPEAARTNIRDLQGMGIACLALSQFKASLE